MRHHRVCSGAALVTVFAVTVLIAPLTPRPVEAQGNGGDLCGMDWSVETRLRRLTGRVMVECGDECFLGFCHSAPFGNWGVDSVFNERHDGDQFKGWKLIDGHRQWNSCTGQYYTRTNDGLGRQRADPDDDETAGATSTVKIQTCASGLPEVRTFSRAELRLYELDLPGEDDHITTLSYGTVNLRINCSDAWNCSGETPWITQRSVDSTGVSAQARFKVSSRRDTCRTCRWAEESMKPRPDSTSLLGVEIRAQEGRKITGVVETAASRQPVANAEVRYEETGIAPQTASTDSKGRFEIPYGTQGVVTVTARNYATARRSWPPRRGQELRFALTPPSAVTITLMDAATRRGIEGRVTVLVKHALNHVSSTETALGTFRFDDLPAGPAVIYARAGGYAPHFRVLTVEGGKRLDAQIGLLLEAVASGKVLDRRGNLAVGATVRVGYSQSVPGADVLASLIRGRVKSDAEGTFSIGGLVPDTSVALQAELDGRLSDIVTVRAIEPGMEQGGLVLRMQ